MTWSVTTGDAVEVMRAMPAASVHCCITSPPYWGLRDYGVSGQIGLEQTLESYLKNLLAVFTEVHRVLRGDGTLWVNMGDSYVTRRNGGIGATTLMGGRRNQDKIREANVQCGRGRKSTGGLKYKDLIGVPWRLAFSLQAAGWWLRRDIIWSKPNSMPESVADRPSCSHEYMFLLSKSATYFYDTAAVREQSICRVPMGNRHGFNRPEQISKGGRGGEQRWVPTDRRNRRSVWSVHTHPFKGAHFATFPPKLIEPCVLAGCPAEGLILDPFSGAGTTGLVAISHGRNYVGIELNPEYADLSRRRIATADPVGRQDRIVL